MFVLNKVPSLITHFIVFRFLKHTRVFSKCTRMAIMPILASEALFRDNKKFQLQNATLVSIEPLDL